MITVSQAIHILSENTLVPSIVKVHLKHAQGKVLAESLYADRDFPPFHRVAMDGIALHFETYESGQRQFRMVQVAAAGQPQISLTDKSTVIEVMTGAILPKGTDTVIPYELLKRRGDEVELPDNVSPGQHVHGQGTDRKMGECLVKAPVLIEAPELGVAATVGKFVLDIYEIPDIALISTGNELVEVDDQPASHQIRSSNKWMLKSAMEKMALRVDTFHVSDRKEDLETLLHDLQVQYPILIFIGGSSAGKFDLVPSALEHQGYHCLFHQISQRPGKPLWFGRKQEQFAFVLPGNPVSCFLCFEKYFKHWINKSLGLSKMEERAILASDFTFKPTLTYFLQVKLSEKHDYRMAYPEVGGGSGDHANLVDVQAFLELPADRSSFKSGESFPLIRFRQNTY